MAVSAGIRAPERLRPIGPHVADRVESVMAAERHAGFHQQQIETASSHRAQRGGGILHEAGAPEKERSSFTDGGAMNTGMLNARYRLFLGQ
jgi:hypothetical protein